MQITESRITRPEDQRSLEIKRLASDTAEAIDGLKSEVAKNKIDYYQFTDKLATIFDESISRLEKIDNKPDMEPLQTHMMMLKDQVVQLKQIIKNKETQVNVAPPKLDKLEKGLKDLPIALQAMIDGVEVMDVEELRKNFKEIIKLLEKIAAVEWVSQGTTIIGGGATTEAVYATKITTVGSVTYIARADPGTAQSVAKWQAQKVDESSGTIITWADGDSNFDNIATDLTALTYS